MKLSIEELKKLDDQVKEIGKFLGMEFDQEYADRRESSWNYQVELISGLKRLSFTTSHYKLQGRFAIRGEFPRDNKGQLHNREYTGITVSIDREPEKIAKSIQVRVLPEYEIKLAEILVCIETANKYHADRLQTLQAVAEYFGQPVPEDDDKAIHPEMGFGIYKIEPDSEGVKFTVTCSVEKALKIFDILKADLKAEHHEMPFSDSIEYKP